MLPMTASSTVGAWFARSAPCWATSCWASASASARDRKAAMWTLYLPCFAAGDRRRRRRRPRPGRVFLLTFFVAPSFTTVELLQLDVSGSTADVDAVVTVAGGCAGDVAAGAPPPNIFEKKPVTPDGSKLDVEVAGGGAADGAASAAGAKANGLGAGERLLVAADATTVEEAAACSPPSSTGA